MPITKHTLQFFTATILEWKHLLADNKCKDILLESLRFLVKENRVRVYCFVIMSNHIHLIWQASNEFTPEKVQHSFLKFTANEILFATRES